MIFAIPLYSFWCDLTSEFNPGVPTAKWTLYCACHGLGRFVFVFHITAFSFAVNPAAAGVPWIVKCEYITKCGIVGWGTGFVSN